VDHLEEPLPLVGPIIGEIHCHHSRLLIFISDINGELPVLVTGTETQVNRSAGEVCVGLTHKLNLQSAIFLAIHQED
jgi:hypothetical protein